MEKIEELIIKPYSTQAFSERLVNVAAEVLELMQYTADTQCHYLEKDGTFTLSFKDSEHSKADRAAVVKRFELIAPILAMAKAHGYGWDFKAEGNWEKGTFVIIRLKPIATKPRNGGNEAANG